MSLKLTTTQFIDKANNKHNNKYTYDYVNYVNASVKVTISCPIHGNFEQSPNSHMAGRGCPKCKIKATSKTKEQFVLDAINVHGDKYDYTKVNYINCETKITIICKEHGEFEQVPYIHLNGTKCPRCPRTTNEGFIKKAILKHNGKYEYSKVDYKGCTTKVIITCPEHGDFRQRPLCHLQGHGCSKCMRDQPKTTEQFIKEAKIVHCNKYTYTKTNYVTTKTKVIITCAKHGDFQQTPNSHLNKTGCPKCKSSKLELRVDKLLTNNNIVFTPQYRIDTNQPYRVDFYIPHLDTVIECHGEQHFRRVPHWHKTEEAFLKQQLRDKYVRDYCKENNIKYIEINYKNSEDEIQSVIKKLITT